MESFQFFGISTVAYILAMVAYISYLVSKNSTVGVIATTLTVGGFIFQTIGFGIRWAEFNELMQLGIIRAAPLANLYESLEFMVWCVILGYLLIEWKYKTRAFGAFITPIAGLALAFIEMSGMSRDLSPLVPALQSNWLLAHVLLSFVGYAGFSIAFAASIIYLALTTSNNRKSGAYIFWTGALGIFSIILVALIIDFLVFRVAGVTYGQTENHILEATFQSESGFIVLLSYIGSLAFIGLLWRYGGSIIKKIADSFSISKEMLDDVTYKSIAVGFPIFGLGGLIIGAIWAEQAWGRYWSWDPKETWSLILWFVYAFYLHARFLRGWSGPKLAIVAVIGFGCMIFTYLGVNIFLSGLHAYGTL